jgi:hypothetical protein
MFDWLTFRRPTLHSAGRRPAASRRPLYLGLFVGIWLGYALYANSLSLPFFQDDFGHIRWLSVLNSPFDPFITATGLPAYRPLGEMLLKIWYLVLGRHDPAWLRFLNIAMHSLNTVLVAALAMRLDRGRGRYLTAGLAAVLFGALPFAYQAVPWINVFFYPLNNLRQLLMVLFYWQARVRARDRGSNRLLALAFLLCFLSPFGIEYGLVNGGLLLAVEAALLLQGRQRSIWFGGPLIGLALNLIFLAIWMIVPKNGYAFGPPTLERLMQISVYLLQGLVYPVAPLALPLMRSTGISDLAAIALVGLPVLLLATVWLVRRKKQPLLVASLIWFGALSFPGLMTLTFDYYINSPRMLYPVGPALAWLWAGLFSAILLGRRRRLLRLALAGLALLLVLGMNIDFIRIRMAHYHIVEGSVHQLGQIARRAEPDNETLVVNMPSWLTPPQRTFALGNNGVQILPFYVSIVDVALAANDEEHPTRAMQFHNVRQPQPYYYGLHGQRVGWDELRQGLSEVGDVYLTRYAPERIDLALAGRAANVQWPDGPLQRAHFDESIDLSQGEYELAGDSLSLDLNWRLQEPVEDDLTVFVHLVGPDGGLVDQADGYPLLGLSPFWLWGQGQTLRDRRELSWPAAAPAGTYRVFAGVYDAANGERLPATDEAGEPLADNAMMVLEFERP